MKIYEDLWEKEYEELLSKFLELSEDVDKIGGLLKDLEKDYDWSKVDDINYLCRDIRSKTSSIELVIDNFSKVRRIIDDLLEG